MRNEPRNQEIIDMLKTHSQSEVARAFGVSRQRVFQIVEMYELELSDETKYHTEIRRRIIESGLLGKVSDEEIARRLGVSSKAVNKARRKTGIEKFVTYLPIGCENCETKPHSKGLCRQCYKRAWRRGLTGG